MRSIPVDTNRLGDLTALDVKPRMEDDNVTQRTDYEGLPVWTVEALLRPAARGDYQPKAEVIEIRVAAKAAPEVPPMSSLIVDGLTARPWQMGDRSGVSLTADTVETLDIN